MPTLQNLLLHSGDWLMKDTQWLFPRVKEESHQIEEEREPSASTHPLSLSWKSTTYTFKRHSGRRKRPRKITIRVTPSCLIITILEVPGSVKVWNCNAAVILVCSLSHEQTSGDLWSTQKQSPVKGSSSSTGVLVTCTADYSLSAKPLKTRLEKKPEKLLSVIGLWTEKKCLAAYSCEWGTWDSVKLLLQPLLHRYWSCIR